MKALCWYRTGDVRVETVPDPKILNPHDCIVKVTSTAICGSDLHLLNGYIPSMVRYCWRTLAQRGAADTAAAIPVRDGRMPLWGAVGASLPWASIRARRPTHAGTRPVPNRPRTLAVAPHFRKFRPQSIAF